MHQETGPVDRDKLLVVEQVFCTRLDGLVAEVTYVPNWAAATEIQLTLAAGINATESRFDIAWWTTHGYKYHYSEPENIQYRCGWERRDGLPDKHFHPPDALDQHEPSLIQHEDPELVTHAILTDWLHAANHSDPNLLNTHEERQ
jgi:hypothetical protein